MKSILCVLFLAAGCTFTGTVTPDVECTNSCDADQEDCYQTCETECVNADGDADSACDTDCHTTCDESHDDCTVTCTDASGG